VSARESRSRRSAERPSGQHLLRSDVLASELVGQANIGPRDIVLEIGAGRGRLTGKLAEAAEKVVAVELDPTFAAELKRRFSGHRAVTIVEADILTVSLPDVPFRVVGNIPFALTTAILKRLLDDPTTGLLRADLIVQFEGGRKRSAVWPTTLLSLGWMPWWDFRLVRHLHAAAFDPPPSVDAGVLSISRRDKALVPLELRREYRAFLRQAFRKANLPIPRALSGQIASGILQRAMRERGIPASARPTDLDVSDWAAVFALKRAGQRTRGNREKAVP
jgi:23S rRNA (adenine-N6)-dimethyltransferase